MTPEERQRYMTDFDGMDPDGLRKCRMLLGIRIAHAIFGTLTIKECKELWANVDGRIQKAKTPDIAINELLKDFGEGGVV